MKLIPQYSKLEAPIYIPNKEFEIRKDYWVD